MKKLIAVALTSLLLAACGKALDGTYTDSSNMMELTFKGNKMEVMGVEMEYKIEDGKVKIKTEGNAVLAIPINDDGSLSYPMIGKLTKK